MVTRDQQIRAMALESAVRLVVSPKFNLTTKRGEPLTPTAVDVFNLADQFVEYIEKGQN